MDRSDTADKRGRRFRRWRRHLLFLLCVALLIAVLFPIGLGYLIMWGATHPACTSGPSPEHYGLIAEAIDVPSRTGAAYRGYFFRGTSGATVIVAPALGQDRNGWLHEVDVLVRGGLNVLTFDSRPCAGIGPHSLGPWEAEDVLDAVEYLRSRGDVDMARIGAHGFSQAGATNIFAAGRSAEIRAVVAEGGYVDYGAQTISLGQSQDAFMTLFGWGARLGYRASTGLNLDDLYLLDILANLAPQRVLMVYGSHEGTLDGARQAAALSDHITLWEVPGATHGSYLASAGTESFRENVVGFYEAALAPPES